MRLPSYWKWGLLALPLGVVVALALFLTMGNQGDRAEAVGAGPEVDVSTTITTGGTKPENPGQLTPGVGCSVKNAPTGTNCSFATNDFFTVNIDVNALIKFPDNDMDTVAGYAAWQARLNWDAGLGFKNRTDTGEVVDPQCAVGDIPVENKGTNTNLIGCVQGQAGAESTFIGTVGQMDFNCSTNGKHQIVLVHGVPLDTHLVDDGGGTVSETGNETMIVDCQPPPSELSMEARDSLNQTLLGGACYDVRDAVQNPLGQICDNGPGTVPDEDPTVGRTVTSVFPDGFTVSVNQSVAPPKYNADPTKQQATTVAGAKVDLVFKNVSKSGNVDVNYIDSITNSGIAGQCSELRSPDKVTLIDTICDGDPADENPAAGSSSHNEPYGDYSVDYVGPLPDQRSLKGTGNEPCSIANGPTKADRTCKVTFTFNPITPFNLKLPERENLFMTRQSTKLAPRTCPEGTNTATFTHELSNAPNSTSPKGEAQTVGAFEFEVRFDNKWVCVNIEPGEFVTGNPQMNWTCFILDKDTSQLEGIARIGCVSKGKEPITNPSLELARIIVRPQPDVFNLVKPGQDNGIDVQIINQDCELSDNQGHPILKLGCDDSELSMRYLEGDVVPDCVVDVLDQQALASRWLATIGNGLYNWRMDLEPTGHAGAPNGDGDIDIKDIQFVFGRHGSQCVPDSAQWPPQPPRKPKAPEPTPAP